MELLFESRPDIGHVTGRHRFIQHRPRVHPEPVLVGDTFVDGRGVVIYGSVHREGGTWRMWYQTYPRDWTFGKDIAGVAHATSDDGITWRKDPLGIVDYGPDPNHLTDLGLHCPSIFIDPHADAEHRFRATGCGKLSLTQSNPAVAVGGYYTAYSADGLRWNLDPGPRWRKSDVITSIYHPGRGHALVAMKCMVRAGGILRRSIFTSELRGDTHTPAVSALIPDEFDDVAAASRGGVSTDYYGMGMMPAGRTATVGFLWSYWHMLPYTARTMGLYGVSDITLVYQDAPGGRWRHMPGRPDFITRADCPQPCGWVYSASNVVEVGDEHRLYISIRDRSHGWHLDEQWKPDPQRVAEIGDQSLSRITFASWPRHRLFGFMADPEATLNLDLPPLDRPHRLKLNYDAGANGHVRAYVENVESCSIDRCHPLTGSALEAGVAWKDSDLIPATSGAPLPLRIAANNATVYAFELVPA